MFLSKNKVKKKEDVIEIPVIWKNPYRGEIFEELTFSGNIEPNEIVTITPKSNGTLEKMYVKIGDYVETDQILATIDNEYANLQYEQVNAMYKIAKKEFERIENLFKEKVVTKSEYDKVESQYQQAEAQLKLAELNLKNTIIKSPINGYVVLTHTNQGQVVGHTTPIYTITDINKTKIKVRIPEKYYSYIRENKNTIKFNIKTITYPDKNFTGKLLSISPYISPENRTFIIELEIDNKEKLLAGGMFADVKIILNYKKNALLLPIESVINNYVWILKDDNKSVEKREIVTGIKNQQDIEILSGLTEQDKVIIEGSNFLDENSIIKVLNN